jgi:hypothetical protein
MIGEDGMVTYKINKKRGAPQDDRISSIQIRQVKKKKKNVERDKKVAGKDQTKRRIEENKTTGMEGEPVDFAHSLFSVVDIRSDKRKHKNRLEIVSRTRQLEDEKGKG